MPAGWSDVVRSQLALRDTKSLLSVAEQVTKYLRAPQGGEFARWLRETVGGLPLRNPEVLQAIAELEVPIATTNYDGLAEEATGLAAVTWRNGFRTERVLRGDARGIVHLHGHWREPTSVILGVRSYAQLLRDGYGRSMLDLLATMRTLVLVGFGAGLDDPNFGALRKWMAATWTGSEHPHYRLVLESERDAAAELHRNEPIAPVVYGSVHEDLARFLRSLRPSGPAEPPATASPASPSTRPARREDSPRSEPPSAQKSAPTRDPEKQRGIRAFICHSSQDKTAVRRLERRLRNDGVSTWLDELALLPGEDWDHAIRNAVRDADIVIVCLSRGSVTKAGYVQKEIRYVLDVADEQPEEAIFLIPARLENCDVPERLRRWHWVDLYRRGGYNRLLAALREAAARRR